MCGLVGFRGDFSDENVSLLRNLMLNSQIRGKHASGIAYFNGKINVEKEPEPMEDFVYQFDFDKLNYKGKIICICHARYSTSDLQYNQPLWTPDLALVHNGVISQADPSTWEELYGYKTETKNDSELLLRCILNGDDPYTKFEGASISALTLDKKGNIKPYRNGYRPLYKLDDGFTIYASTKDIITRSLKRDTNIELLEPYGTEYQIRSIRKSR